MMHMDGEPYEHDHLIYLGFEMHVTPPIELQQEIQPPYAEAVIGRYLAERYDMSSEELAPTAQQIGDALDQLELTKMPAGIGVLIELQDTLQEWLPDHKVTLR